MLSTSNEIQPLRRCVTHLTPPSRGQRLSPHPPRVARRRLSPWAFLPVRPWPSQGSAASLLQSSCSWPNHSLKQPAATRRAPNPQPLGGPPSAAPSPPPPPTIPPFFLRPPPPPPLPS